MDKNVELKKKLKFLKSENFLLIHKLITSFENGWNILIRKYNFKIKIWNFVITKWRNKITKYK